MTIRSAGLPAALVAAVLSAAPLAAQAGAPAGAPASSTKGFFLGAHLNGSAVKADDLSEDSESGGGLGLQLGYGFTSQLALVLDGTAALIESNGEEATVGHFDIALRYAFTGQTRRVVPFLELGYSGLAVAQDDAVLEGVPGTGDLTITGSGYTLGGGLQYYVSPKLALGVGLKWTSGEFDRAEFAGEEIEDLGIDATSTRINLGITWYPMAGR
jgi:opacity protein-like surface antigen